MNFGSTPPENADNLRGANKRPFVLQLVGLLLAGAALTEIVLPLLLPSDHATHFWFERLPGWGSLYGFVSCVAIIVVSKFLGKVWLTRREDYWSQPQSPTNPLQKANRQI